VALPVADLERGRESYAGQAWMDAYDALSAADRSASLAAEDLDLLATSAYMVGRENEYLDLLERAHRAHLAAGHLSAAVRSALWVGITLARLGEIARATGWLGRAQRLLEREQEDCAERAYLLLPLAFEQEAGGDWEGATRALGEAAAAGERFGDADLFALAAHEQGHVLIQHGRLGDGLRLLDESMVAVTTGELSPIVSGIVYCGVILACQDAFDVRRAREWTAALTRWCERQPDLVAFTGRCLVHRAEILQLGGTWAEALHEARRAGERCLEGGNAAAAGEACYRQGEIHRVLGDFEAAERSYRDANLRGRLPQPGLALLRLADGQVDAAAAAIRTALTETSAVAARAALLPAAVEIVVAAGDLEAARAACEELDAIAAEQEAGALGAMAAHARGTLALAVGDAQDALASLRRAVDVWQALQAPYEAARARVLVGLACRALGDEETAALELEAARTAFVELGATPELARLDSLVPGAASRGPHGLTERELEVLRHVAAGATNKAIAAELVLSVRTVDRHMSNIFAKLGVSSRAAATAFAHEHRLVQRAG